MSNRSVAAVLFDLDGTLVDTAPDLIGALNDLRQEHALSPLGDAELLPHVSDGSVGLVGHGMPEASAEVKAAWRESYLDIYTRRLSVSSHVYNGMLGVLRQIEAAGCAWGVVTNKPFAMAAKLLRDLHLWERAGVVLGGDSLTVRKPDPAPVLEACHRLHVQPSSAVFVGDDLRDMQAGAAAGTATIAVSWGYLRATDQINSWPAGTVVHHPQELSTALAQWLAHA